MDLSHLDLRELPESISELSGLVRLSCKNNQISDLLPLAGLSGLVYLDCEKNPIKNPPLEVVNQGIEAIREYFADENKKKESLNEIKVMFIGTGGSGKTTIRQKLCEEEINPDEQGTQGIDVRRLEVNHQGKTLRLNLWDFAGQEINYSLHEMIEIKDYRHTGVKISSLELVKTIVGKVICTLSAIYPMSLNAGVQKEKEIAGKFFKK